MGVAYGWGYKKIFCAFVAVFFSLFVVQRFFPLVGVAYRWVSGRKSPKGCLSMGVAYIKRLLIVGGGVTSGEKDGFLTALGKQL